MPNALLGLLSGYLGLLTVAAWRAARGGRLTTAVSGDATHRFVVVIPAHDEERLIGETLRSLAKVDYPATHHAIHVVADNCTDATAAIARDMGAVVHERTAPEARGKGPALNWLLDRLGDEPFDAVVYLDADSVVSQNFLRVMDARLGQGDRVVQAHYAVRDPGRSWAVALRYAALAVRHHLRPLARTSLGCSAGLHGNGMVVAADVMRGRRWSTHLTEDIAFEAELLLAGERVAFAPDAVVEAEMPERLADAGTQNARWERGRLGIIRRHVPRLARAALTADDARRVVCADAAVDHLVPPMSLVTLLIAEASLTSTVLWLLRRTALSRINLGLALGAAGVQAAYLVSGLRLVGAPPPVWRALLYTPRFVLWKAARWASMVGAGEDVPWVRTTRNR